MFGVKGFLRAVIRIVIEILHRLILHLPDTLFGFLNWPPRKMRIKIFILYGRDHRSELDPKDLDKAIEFAKAVFKMNFNVHLLPLHKNGSFVEVLKATTPKEVLYTKGGKGALSEEFEAAGNFFAAHNDSPIYPVTIFVVEDIEAATGCSLGPLTDYITLSRDGVKQESVLAHELAHACGLWHVKDKANLLWNRNDRGYKIRWWQRNIFRSSRHVTYW